MVCIDVPVLALLMDCITALARPASRQFLNLPWSVLSMPSLPVAIEKASSPRPQRKDHHLACRSKVATLNLYFPPPMFVCTGNVGGTDDPLGEKELSKSVVAIVEEETGPVIGIRSAVVGFVVSSAHSERM